MYTVISIAEIAESVFAIASYVLFVIFAVKCIASHVSSFGVFNDSVQHSKKRRDHETIGNIKYKFGMCLGFICAHFVLVGAYREIYVLNSVVNLACYVVSAVLVLYAFSLLLALGEWVYDDETEI
jgi:hypothetical protein